VEYSSNAEIEAGAPAACRQKLGPGLAAEDVPATTGLEGEGRARPIARLLATATQPFAGLDPDGRVSASNRAFAAQSGDPLRDPSGVPFERLITPDSRAALAGALAGVRRTGEPARFEVEFLRDDGPAVPVEVDLEADRDGHGELVGFLAFLTDLSERKRVERALRESEERFRLLFDEAPVGYHEVDDQGILVSINRTECEILGYRREELVGRPVFDLVAEEYREAARRNFPDKVAGRRPLAPIERTVVTRDGRRLVISIEERYRRDARGAIVGLRSTMRDVTDQKRAEAALVASERRARALFEGMEEAVFVHDAHGKILDANPAASRLLGYARDELLGMTTADIDDAEFAVGFEERLARQMAQGHLSCVGRHRTKDGRVIPVEVNTSTIQLDDRPAVLAVIRDISERVALEETRRAFAEAQTRNAREMAAKNAELTVSEARYRQLTEGCLDGVVAADRDGRVTLFNPAAERMFGYRAGEVVGRPLADLMPRAFPEPSDRPFDRDVIAASPGLVGQTVEVVGRRRSGEEFPIELSLSAVEVRGETRFVGSIRDQTERQRMRAMLARSEKLASIGMLSAGVAHEINNPLAYVGNNVAVLERDLAGVLRMVARYEAARPALADADPAALAAVDALADEVDWDYVRDNLPGMLARTREGVQRVANIVGSLRNFARTSPARMEAANVRELYEGALEVLRGRLRRGQIQVAAEHGECPPLVCVPAQISQVILNLLINAMQAVELAGRPGAGWIRFASAREGEAVVLTVADNGCGVAPDDLPRLFDPFFTTKGVGEGTGLGLSICHGIVTGHGGRIEVESRPGAGTTFRVEIPLKPLMT
jgi:PAS domain S-box-containing protein